MAIWVVQWAGQEIRVLDYIEGVRQVLGYYTNELRARGYQKALCYLPHDGVNANVVTGLRFQDHLKDAEFQVEVIKAPAPRRCGSKRCGAPALLVQRSDYGSRQGCTRLLPRKKGRATRCGIRTRARLVIALR